MNKDTGGGQTQLDALDAVSDECSAPLRGDRAVPCESGSTVSLPLVAKVLGEEVEEALPAPMVRPSCSLTSMTSLDAETKTRLKAGEKTVRWAEPLPSESGRMTTTFSTPHAGEEVVRGKARISAGECSQNPTENSSVKRAHPESYEVVQPSYLRLSPEKLQTKWASYPMGAYDVVLFQTGDYPEQEKSVFSNFFISPVFEFCVPDWCNAQWLLEKRRRIQVAADNGEKLLVLCKAALMKDLSSFDKVLKVRSPREARMLGDQIQNFDQVKWHRSICAIVIAIVRARVEGIPFLLQQLEIHAEKLFAHASSDDSLLGTGLDHDHPGTRHPSQWCGANVLGWAYMAVAATLVADSKRKQQRTAPRLRDVQNELLEPSGEEDLTVADRL